MISAQPLGVGLANANPFKRWGEFGVWIWQILNPKIMQGFKLAKTINTGLSSQKGGINYFMDTPE